MATTKRPARRHDFEIAVVCALPLEYDAAALAFDEFFDEDGDVYGRSPGDPNAYTTGRVGQYSVVLVLLSNMGTISSAAATASLRSSYTGLRLALLTGICGGVPGAGVVLGDVVIGKTVVQYGLGRLYPGGFVRKDALDDELGRAARDVRNLVAVVETDHGGNRVRSGAARALAEIQAKAAAKKRHRAKYNRPPASEDRLFEAGYVHRHRDTSNCVCADGALACGKALEASCEQLRCDPAQLVPRERLEDDGDPEFDIFVGRFGSGDSVVKSGSDRDRLAKAHGLIAFEMEGAGVWDELPSIVVKGVCDYADSHKNKRWQAYAAATAAAVMKALLVRYIRTDGVEGDAGGGKERDAGGGASELAPVSSPVPVYSGRVSGRNVVFGNNITGGTTTMNFG